MPPLFEEEIIAAVGMPLRAMGDIRAIVSLVTRMAHRLVPHDVYRERKSCRRSSFIGIIVRVRPIACLLFAADAEMASGVSALTDQLGVDAGIRCHAS